MITAQAVKAPMGKGWVYHIIEGNKTNAYYIEGHRLSPHAYAVVRSNGVSFLTAMPYILAVGEALVRIEEMPSVAGDAR